MLKQGIDTFLFFDSYHQKNDADYVQPEVNFISRYFLLITITLFDFCRYVWLDRGRCRRGVMHPRYFYRHY